MSRRQLYEIESNIRRIAQQVIDNQVRRAFLLTAYSGTPDPETSGGAGAARMVLVTFTDPQIGTRGTTVRARVRPGTSIPAATAGSPVTVRIRHGQVEVLSFG